MEDLTGSFVERRSMWPHLLAIMKLFNQNDLFPFVGQRCLSNFQQYSISSSVESPVFLGLMTSLDGFH